jgi:hypothetical protein
MEVHRKKIFSGVVVSMKVPKNASQGSVPGTDVRFWQFALNVPGGCVNVFVHSSEDVRGRSVVCQAEVWNKQMGTSRWFNHLDLHPCDDPITHR